MPHGSSTKETVIHRLSGGLNSRIRILLGSVCNEQHVQCNPYSRPIVSHLPAHALDLGSPSNARVPFSSRDQKSLSSSPPGLLLIFFWLASG